MRKQDKKRRERLKQEFGQDPRGLRGAEWTRERLDEIRVYYEETLEELQESRVDEITWNDLEMDEMFLRINHTRCYIGEQVLYRRLHDVQVENGESGAHWNRFEKCVELFSKEEEKRLQLEQELLRIGKNREDYYLPMFLKNAGILKVEHLWVYRILQLMLLCSFLFGVLLGIEALRVVFVVTAMLNLTIYTASKQKYEVYLYSLGSVKDLVIFCQSAMKKEKQSGLFADERVENAMKSLQKLKHMIGRYQGKKTGLWTGNAVELLWDYLIGITLWDITFFGQLVNVIEGKQEDLFILYEFAGEIDIQIAVASFRKSLSDYCLPIFDDVHEVRAEALYHPLVGRPVTNDFYLQKNCMITGANASGKSTFCKALAVNAILAQTIHTCAAKEFRMSKAQVLTSMAVRDDVVSGESYYMREIGYLKRIVDAAQRKEPVLIMIDEILRGTNTRERLAASEAVCRYLKKENCLTIVATHDMELAERMRGDYECYYFKSEICERDIVFDYKIYKGMAENSNAIQLLAYMGFPEEIVETAYDLI